MKCKLLAIALVLLLALTACNNSNEPKEVTDMAYTAEICGQSFSGTYTGTTVEELPHGAGTFTYESKKEELTYSGQWENGTIIGIGELEYDGFVLEYNETEYIGLYSGQTENGFPCGEGTFEGEKRDKYLVYEGSWKDGNLAEEGYLEANEFPVDVGNDIIRYGDFKGDVIDGIPTGEGSYSAKNDKGITYTYKGNWLSGQFNGEGELIFNHNNYYIQRGNFTNGVFAPTPIQFFTAIGTLEKSDYTIIKKARTFLEQHPDVFLTNNCDGFEIDKSFKYNEFTKDKDNFGDSLITVYMTVQQIWVEEFWGNNFTFCLGYDGSCNYYFMYMYNSAENIFENNWIQVTMLPLDHFTYETVSNTQQWAMAAAAVTITK